MKTPIFAFVPLFLVGLTACEIDQTERAEVPDVDVDVEDGNMPEYDVDWADVDVATRTETIKVPTVVVAMEEREVEVPYIDMNMPDETDADKTETTIRVESEVRGKAHDLNIQEIYAKDNSLMVLSKLSPNGQDLQDETMRVSDQVKINASDDLEIRHYIMGEKPSGSFNDSYRYIQSKSAIAERLDGAKRIYSAS